jgi:uncharacterized lipoprotein YajG
MKQLSMLALPILLCMATAGCALTTDTETIGYHSLPGASIVVGADRTTLQVSAVDGRGGNPAQFSNKKNAFGSTMAPILSDKPVSDVVQAAVVEELRHRGFNVGAGGSVVTIKVQSFNSDYDVGFWGADANAVVVLVVEVRGPTGAALYSNVITGKGLEPSNQVFNGRNARIAVEGALADAIKELMNDPTFFQALTRAGRAGA